MKKIALLFMAATICTMLNGNVLTAKAACGHANGGHPVWSSTTKADAGSHIYGTGKVCYLKTVTDHYKVICNDCASVISTYSTSYTSHSVAH